LYVELAAQWTKAAKGKMGHIGKVVEKEETTDAPGGQGSILR
jgi:hypothetical protein